MQVLSIWDRLSDRKKEPHQCHKGSKVLEEKNLHQRGPIPVKAAAASREKNSCSLRISWGFAANIWTCACSLCIVNHSWICRLNVYEILWKDIILNLRISNLGCIPVDLNCLFFVRRRVSFRGNQPWPQSPCANLLRGVCAKPINFIHSSFR